MQTVKRNSNKIVFVFNLAIVIKTAIGVVKSYNCFPQNSIQLPLVKSNVKKNEIYIQIQGKQVKHFVKT